MPLRRQSQTGGSRSGRPMLWGALLSVGLSSGAIGQPTETELDLRADPPWLSDSVIAPHRDIASSALPAPITAMPLDVPALDAVGLLPFSVTGLPAELWGASDPKDLADLFRGLPVEGLPAMLDFTETLALAELDAPRGGTSTEALFLARLDMLLARGALEPARALIERAGPTDAALFRRFFDVSLLTGQVERACAALRANPDIDPAFPTRIFCLARGGDWPAAALSLGTGQALGFISDKEADVIARFLDPELFEGEPPLPRDPAITPLYYEMRAAIGERPASLGLPLAFSHSDLSDVAGWEAQVTAAERLIRAGAIAPQEWQALATARRATISGPFWERLRSLQRFDAAILANNARDVAEYLPEAAAAMRQADLSVAFAELYAEPLMRLPLSGEVARQAHMVGLLSPAYELVAQRATPLDAEERFLFDIARGLPSRPPQNNRMASAVADAFATNEVPSRYAWLIREDRRGEALLLAADVLLSETADADDLGAAIRLYRALGLETVARRAALQLLLTRESNI